MTETGKLDGRVAVVTGGGGGIGRAICLALASAGAEVVVADLDENSGRATTADVERGNGSARFQQLDVTDEASWKELYDHLWDTSRRLDIVVNNAGIFLLRHIEETTVEEWGCVPEYKSALEIHLGQGALKKFDNESQKHMPLMNKYSKILYENFKKLIK